MAAARRPSATRCAWGPCTFPRREAFSMARGVPNHAAVAKLGNGARFRVSSRRGSQVRILAAASQTPYRASFLDVQQGHFLQGEIGPLVRRQRRPFRLRDADRLERLPSVIEDSIVARPSEYLDQFIHPLVAEDHDRDFLRVLVNSGDSNRIGITEAEW